MTITKLNNLTQEDFDKFEKENDEYDKIEREEELLEKHQQQFIEDLYEYSEYFNKYCNYNGLMLGESLVVNDFFELIMEEIK